MSIRGLFDVLDFLPGSGGTVRPFVFGPGAAIAAGINLHEAREEAAWARSTGFAVPAGQVDRLFWVLLCSLVALVCLKKCALLLYAGWTDRDADVDRLVPRWAHEDSWSGVRRRLMRSAIGTAFVVVACLAGAASWAEQMSAQPL